MKLNDTCVSDDLKSDDDDVAWKKNIIKKRKYFKNFIDQFVEYLISKFFDLTKKIRLKSKRIQKMQIEKKLLKWKKKLLETLFNREIAFLWNFVEKESIRSEITSFLKIRTISHETWQVFEFQIFKALTRTIVEMIKNWIKNDVLKSCYDFYKNSRFLIKKKKKKTNIIWSMSF